MKRMILPRWRSAAAPALGPAAAAGRARRAVDYASEASWLCLPGRARRLRAAAGRPPISTPTATARSRRARPPPIRRSTASTSIRPSRAIPGSTATWCRRPRSGRPRRSSSPASPRSAGPIAPLYRQVTLGAIPRALGGEDVSANFNLAYGDVARRLALLSRPLQSRPAVRADRPQPGHDPSDPAARRGDREQPGGGAAALGAADRLCGRGAAKGRSSAAACSARRSARARGQTGCVVTYMSFRAEQPAAGEGALMGRATRAGHDRGLRQSRRRSAGGSAPLDPLLVPAAVEPVRRPRDHLVVDRAPAGDLPPHRRPGLGRMPARRQGRLSRDHRQCRPR